MAYVYVVSGQTIIETFRNSSSALKPGEIENSPQGEGLFFDLESIHSVLVWINDNRDVVVASANLLKASIVYLTTRAKQNVEKDKQNKEKPEEGTVKIIIRGPTGDEKEIEITATTNEDEITNTIKKLVGLEHNK